MKRKGLLLILLFPFMLFAQVDLDSLREVGNMFLTNQQYDNALKVFDEGIKSSRKTNDKRGEAFLLIDKGMVYQQKDELKEALDFYSSSNVIGEQLNDPDITGSTHLNMGIVYKQMGLYEKAMVELLKAVKIVEKNETDKDRYASCLNTIANVQMLLKNYSIAMKFHKNALALREQLRDTDEIAHSLNNIGKLFKEEKQYDSAIIYFQRSLYFKKLLQHTESIANTIDALGTVYDILKQYPAALSCYMQAYTSRKSIPDPIGIGVSGNHLGSLYTKLGQYDKAEPFLDESRMICQREHTLHELLDNYDLSRNLYRHIGQADKALQFDNLYIALSDTLLNIETQRSLNEMQVKYDSDKKDADLMLLVQQREIDEARFVFLLSGIVLLMLVSVVTAWAYYQKKKDKERIEILMRELNHRVKNNLQILSDMMSLQYEQLDDEKARYAIREMENRVKAMSVVHRKLYKGKQLTFISIPDFIRELAQELMLSYGFDQHTLHLSFRLEDTHLHADKAIPLGLIMNEILCNAFKYAFRKHPEPKLSIELMHTGKTQMRITIQDNGPGIPERKQEEDSFGFSLVRMLCRQLHAELIITCQEGTGISITMDYL